MSATNAQAAGLSPADQNRLSRQNSRATIKKEQRVTFAACFLGLVASVGGFMFGYVR